MNAKQHQGGEGLQDIDADGAGAMLKTGNSEDSGAGVDDDQEGGTTGSASMTGGDQRGVRSPDAPDFGGGVHAAGRWGSNVEGEMAPLDARSAEPGPMGAGGGAQGGGSGSHGTGTYNQAGDLTGPDGPGDAAEGEGQGDDLANRLGGGEDARGGMAGAAAVSGDQSAGRSEGGGGPAGYVPDAGSPGGMGGVSGRGKAPGGVSPILKDED